MQNSQEQAARLKRIQWLNLLREKNPKAVQLELAKCKSDPWYFLTNWVYTEDSQDRENPHKLFPNKPHLQTITNYWLSCRFLAVPKSRQLSLSWNMVALYLWESLFFKSRISFFINKKESDSEALCERAHFMYEKLAPFFKDFVQVDRKFCNLKFSNRSIIIGAPQGADQIRGFTVSGLLLDECAFNDELHETIGAAIPAIGLHGKITLISSAAPSTFAQLVFDQS